MCELQVLLVAGTHGNEINAPWLIDQWSNNPSLIDVSGFSVAGVLGNRKAFNCCRRYLERDLNRSFSSALLTDSSINDYEVLRARELVSQYGPDGTDPCQIAIDLHSTTACMGSSLVLYGRRPADLALASFIQASLGIPVYLHEADNSQKGFLVESWPCGLVVEIGPVPQGLLEANVIRQTKMIIEVCFEEIAKIRSGNNSPPNHLIVHRHIRSIDFPRNSNGEIIAYLHPELIGKDWYPLSKDMPIFVEANGNIIRYLEDDCLIPVFINEASYMEKNIAMSLTKRELWSFKPVWLNELNELIG